MKYICTLALVLAIPLLVRAQKKYYVDKSCSDRPEWKSSFDLAIQNAKRASERLSSTTDTDFQAVVDRLFKRGATNEEIKAPLDDIASWVETEPRATSLETLKPADIRFFCDNDKVAQTADPTSDARWKKRNKPSISGTYYDFKNHMLSDILTCQDSQKEAGFTLLNRARLPAQQPGTTHPMDGQNPGRVVVTICDAILKPQPSWQTPDEYPLTVDDGLKKADWNRRNIEFFSFLIAHTLLHEMIHASTNGRINDRPDNGHAYQYVNCAQQNPEDGYLNAENYGLFAMVADWGYSLPRLNRDGIPDAQKQQYNDFYEKQAAEGFLRHYTDLTKRVWKIMAKRFVA